ncbi:MAG: FecR domain-containing protein [Sphingobium sp.]|nr:FecR domain-containing protein [Sphingobium sp.]
MSARNDRTREEIEEQAALFVIALHDDADADSRARILAWIDESPHHAVAFARAEAAWEETARLKGCVQHEYSVPAAREESANDPLDPATPTRRRFLVGGLLAASAVGVVSIGSWLTGRNYHETGVGETRDIRLADGSALHLNTNSAVRVDYTADRRRLTLLRGEAYFDVAHDPARPFDVAIGNAVVRALGTAFNLRRRDQLVELTVTDGLVGVRTSGDTALHKVPAGEGAFIRAKSVALATLAEAEVGQRVAWRTHVIELTGESVVQAVEEFNRYRAHPIVIGDQRIASLRIGGRFSTDESQEFLTALELSLPIKAVTDADGGVMLIYRDDITPGPASDQTN